MTAMLEASTAVGAPYRPGDVLLVERHRVMVEARVQSVSKRSPAPFGRHWRLCVELVTREGVLAVNVDDDGHNHTIGCRVGPSDKVDE